MALRDLMPWSSASNVPVRHPQGDPVYELQQRMNRLFDSFWDDDLPMSPFAERRGQFMPSVNVSENDNEIVVEAEMPGLTRDDIDVSLERGALVLKGEKKNETETSERGYTHIERSWGAFSRAIPLSAEVKAEKVSADFNNGVLTVTLPKAKPSKSGTRKIDIKSE